MCGGFKYQDENGDEKAVFFPNPQAKLPVIRKDGGIEWVTWGRRADQNQIEDTNFPMTGWCQNEKLQNKESYWNQRKHKVVDLAATAFMEKDESWTTYWFELPHDKKIKALILIDGPSSFQWRGYIITTTPPDNPFEAYPANYQQTIFGEERVHIHERWPLIE